MNNSFDVTQLTDDIDLAQALAGAGLSLTPGEARKIAKRLGRAPNLAELFVFDIEWSEHCSYKSSKPLLKKYLPTSGPTVIQGPEEDAGIIELGMHDGRRWGIVIAHESHNHPSQVLPFEGAATGIGGIVRDVDCMGARVIGCADPLRFGDPAGENAVRTKHIANGVIRGIWQYGNALGVPNLGGDLVFHPGYDDNCLVNVVAIGLVAEDDILHSRAPKGSAGYDLILVGKPTDSSGFGGASFASGVLDGDQAVENKGAVQVPDPFLKNVLIHRKANEAVWNRARELGYEIGMKDLGAGGIMCCSTETGASGGFGVELHLDNVHVGEKNLPPYVVLCAETQERFLFAVPKEFSEEALHLYNEVWDLPTICAGAKASVIGTVIEEQVFRVLHHGETVVDLPIEFVVEGILYDRESREPQVSFPTVERPEPEDLNEVLLRILGSVNIASRHPIYNHYDTEVQGQAVIRSGEADAGVIAPIPGCKLGMALSTDGNPFVGEVSPFRGGQHSVAEAMRNVAATGARPVGLTDCLNYGNPENPEHFWQMEQGIQGVADAARNLYDPRGKGEPIPFVSGNVSLYNFSVSGKAIPPSAIVTCVGRFADVSIATSMELKKAGNRLLLIGERYDELGASEYDRLCGRAPAEDLPAFRAGLERALIYGTIEAIEAGLVRAAHDIADGGLAVAAAEMILRNPEARCLGLELDLSALGVARPDTLLFSESPGMLLEVAPEKVEAVEKIYASLDAKVYDIGAITQSPRLTVKNLLDLSVVSLSKQWGEALNEIFS